MTVEDLYTDAFDDARKGWLRSGTSPYLGDNADYVNTNLVANEEIGDWGFPNTAMGAGDTLNAVYLRLYATRTAAGFEVIDVYVHDGSAWSWAGIVMPETAGVWGWHELDVSSILNTLAKINACKVYFLSITANVKLRVNRLVGRVDYSPPPTTSCQEANF